MSDAPLTHLDDHGHARMVDVTGKAVTHRHALARGVVRASEAAVKSLLDDEDAVPFSRAAGVVAAARAPQLVPLCHPLPLDDVHIRVEIGEDRVDVVAEASVVARTGVEIEALTACGVAALNLLMVLLANDPTAHIDSLALWEKSGGRSGTWRRSGSSGSAGSETGVSGSRAPIGEVSDGEVSDGEESRGSA